MTKFKRIKLSQPYASMVVAGVLQTIPNIWDDVKAGERIYIYADEPDDEFKNGIDETKSLHRKILNEMSLGNIPDNGFPVNAYIGFVKVYYKGRICKEWIVKSPKAVFVHSPEKLLTRISDFNADDNALYKVRAHSVVMKSMARVDSKIYVPVSQRLWKLLHNVGHDVNFKLYWEDYMERYVPLLFSNDGSDYEEITDMYFQYREKYIHFFTEDGIGQSISDPPIIDAQSGYRVMTFEFPLDYLYDENDNSFKTLNTLYFHREQKQNKNYDEEIYDPYRDLLKEEENKKESGKSTPYIHFISTPMGGMTRWRRR